MPSDRPKLQIVREVAPPQGSVRTDCLHCGLRIPARGVERGDQFCCDGCRRVYELIGDRGLEQYYELRRGETVPPATLRPDGMAWLEPLLLEAGERDESIVAGAAVPDASRRDDERGAPTAGAPAESATGLRRLTLDVQGIHCAACVWLLRELYLRQPGAVDLRINPSLGQAELTWSAGQTDVRGYLAEAERFGYRFGPRRKARSPHSQTLLIRMGVTAAAAMNVMIFSFTFYAGLGPQDGRIYSVFGQLNFLLTLFAVLAGGWPFLRAAVNGLRRGLIHLDVPIALGILLAFAGSVYAHVIDGPRAAYYDTVATFVTLMLVGRWLQERVLERNRNTLLSADGLDHLMVRRVRGESIESVPARTIAPGDELWIVPGDLVPVAATVLHRPAELSLDWITGESAPRRFMPGERLPAGAVNAAEVTVHVAALETLAESNLSDLVGGTEEEDERQRRRSASGERWWNRVGTIYVLGVLSAATTGFLLWIGRGMEDAIRVTVSILAVTCPCALGLAIPLAHELAHLGLKRQGIFLRRGSFLDRALHVRKVVFDKTGTLTFGRLVPSPEAMAVLRTLPDAAIVPLYNLAVRSNHPVSRALAEAIRRERPEEARVVESGDPDDATPSREVHEVAGFGLRGSWSGRVYRLGRPAFAEPGPPAAIEAETWFSVDGKRLAAFTFVEEIRPDVLDELRGLRAEGMDVHLLSGDRQEKTRAVAERLGIAPGRFEGELDPWAKAERIRALDQDDTLMVGDGLNDAPSFDAAFCTATPAVDRPALPARADLYFLGEGIGAIRRSLLLARRLRGVVRANLGFAAVYNAVALTLCFTGRIDPLVAAILMPVSSLIVVGHTAWRLTGRRLAWMS